MWRLNQVFQNKTSLFLTPNYNRCFLCWNRACAQLCDESEIEKNQFKRPVLICGCKKVSFPTRQIQTLHDGNIPDNHNPKNIYFFFFLMTDTKKELKDWRKHELTYVDDSENDY